MTKLHTPTTLLRAGATTAVTLAAGTAAADVVDVDFTDTDKGRTVRLGFYEGDTQTSSMKVFAGELEHTFSGGTGLGGLFSGSFTTFCVDVHQSVSRNATEFDVVSLASVPGPGGMGNARAGAISSLFTVGTSSYGSMDRDFAAAFQLLVWEIVADYDATVGIASIDLSTGSFRATKGNGSQLWSGVNDDVETLLSSMGTAGLDVGNPGVWAFASDTYQDQLVFAPQIIPSPGSAALAAVGGLCFSVRRRRENPRG
ncbi:MAG: hypothetical protein AAF235_02705 [Planctomycetota bacterium]